MIVGMGIVEFRSDLGNKESNVSAGLEMIEQAGSRVVSILVFKGLWTTGYLAGSKFNTLAEKIPLASALSRHKIFLARGSIAEVAGRKMHDTLLAADGDLDLVEKVRANSNFNLHIRRPELYQSLRRASRRS